MAIIKKRKSNVIIHLKSKEGVLMAMLFSVKKAKKLELIVWKYLKALFSKANHQPASQMMILKYDTI